MWLEVMNTGVGARGNNLAVPAAMTPAGEPGAGWGSAPWGRTSITAPGGTDGPMKTGWGPGAAGGRTGAEVPAGAWGGDFKNAGNMPLCPVTGIIWQRTGVLGMGTEIRGVAFPGKSFS